MSSVEGLSMLGQEDFLVKIAGTHKVVGDTGYRSVTPTNTSDELAETALLTDSCQGSGLPDRQRPEYTYGLARGRIQAPERIRINPCLGVH